MSIKDVLSPLYVWKRAFSKPFVINKPLNERPGADRYRGFHINDMDKCIGCGTCEEICQNAAIDLVPVDGQETKNGDSGLRPKIDYGRCCWCALCVDICPTGSLAMSNEYTWVDTDPEVFRFVPGADEKPWDNSDKGYKRAENYELLNLKREDMEMLDAENSVKSFIEMVKGYSLEKAVREADRCISCGICISTCPAHMSIPEYIECIRNGDLEKGLKILYETNPLSGACGRICTHLCEEVCALNHRGDPISIRWLKRYIIDQFSPEQMKEILHREFPGNDKKIAIIGGGPAGLSAAFYLKGMGYSVKIFERNEGLGGALKYGVPDYRLPPEALKKDIDHILSLGVDVEYNTGISNFDEFSKLVSGFDAVFMATGLDQPYELEIPGEENPNVINGLEFLDKTNKGISVEIGDTVAVIGGGNVAMDAARVARRYGAEVSVLYRRRIEDMPADEEEIHEATAEKVKMVPQAIPLEIKENADGCILVWGEAEMVQKEGGGRPSPVLIKDKIHEDRFSTVIKAIGQSADHSFLSEELADKIITRRNKVRTNEKMQTADEVVFAGGDTVNNTADAISAIADGHRAAKGIDKYLNRG